MKKSLLICSLALSSITAFAQEKNHGFFDDWSVQASLNHNLIRGDVLGLQVRGTESYLGYEYTPEKEDKIDLGFGVRIAKNLSPAVDLGLSFNTGQMTGSKRVAGNHIWTMRHAILDFNHIEINGRIYFNRLAEYLGKQPKLHFYTEIGMGRVFIDWENGQSDDTRLPDATSYEDSKIEGKENEYVGSIGLGLEYKVAQRLSVSLTSKMFLTRSDDLDGLNEQHFANENDDYFVISSLGLAYDLSKGNTGYKWHNQFGDFQEGISANAKAIEKSNDRINSLKGQISKLNSDLAAEIALRDDTRVWKDSDKDGVHDEDDKEANTKAGSLVNFQGIAINTGSATGALLFNPVFFDTDKYNVKEKGFESIAEVALYMQEHKDDRIKLVGYADHRGSDEHNVELSRNRTLEVRKILTEKFGIDASRLEIDYKGESVALSDLLSVNRRVDFIVIK